MSQSSARTFLVITTIHGIGAVTPFRNHRTLTGPRCLSRFVRELRDERGVSIGPITTETGHYGRIVNIASPTPGAWDVRIMTVPS